MFVPKLSVMLYTKSAYMRKLGKLTITINKIPDYNTRTIYANLDGFKDKMGYR